MVKRGVGRIHADVAALEQNTHVGWDQSVCQTAGCSRLLNVSQVEGIRGIQVDDVVVVGESANPRLPDRIFKG